MSDSYAFRSRKNGSTIVIFGVSLQDAKQCLILADKKDIEYLGKNIQMPKTTLARVTDKQMAQNRLNFERLMVEI